MRIFIWETIGIIIADAIAIFASFACAYYFRLFTFSHSLFPFENYISMGLIMIPLWIFLLGISGRYALKDVAVKTTLGQIFFVSLSSSLLFPLLFYFSNDRFFSRGIILLLFFFSVVFLSVVTLLAKKYAQYTTSLLIIGANRDAVRIIHALQVSGSRHVPTVILAPYGSKSKDLHGVPIVGKLDALDRVVEEYAIDEIFICEGVEHSENIASFCRNKGIPLKISIETLGMTSTSIDPQTIGGTVFLTMQQSPLFGWGQFWKRFFDICFALLGLVIFSPLWLWYRKKMKRVCFQKNSQETFSAFVIVGEGGSMFLSWTLLWNVLHKDISVVGPRLFTQEEYRVFFQGMRAGKQARTLLRSGIFSPSSGEKTPEEVLQKDIQYIQNWSFGKDFWIIFT